MQTDQNQADSQAAGCLLLRANRSISVVLMRLLRAAKTYRSTLPGQNASPRTSSP